MSGTDASYDTAESRVGGLIMSLADGTVTSGGAKDGSAGSVWRCTDKYEPGWYRNDFNDGHWKRPLEEGANGAAPWGTVSGVASNARWIWLPSASATASSAVSAVTAASSSASCACAARTGMWQ